jgi:hypothetical protein
MRAIKKAKAFEDDPLFVEPTAWAPLYGAWQEQAKNTRELAGRAANDRAKKLLLLVADGYDRLAK